VSIGNHRADYAAFNEVIEAYREVKTAQASAWTGFNNLDFTSDVESCIKQGLEDKAAWIATFSDLYLTQITKEIPAQHDILKLRVGVVLNARRINRVYSGIIRRTAANRVADAEVTQ
jgi:hypothetical protein